MPGTVGTGDRPLFWAPALRGARRGAGESRVKGRFSRRACLLPHRVVCHSVKRFSTLAFLSLEQTHVAGQRSRFYRSP